MSTHHPFIDWAVAVPGGPLFRDAQLHRGMDPAGPDLPDELLAQAAARDDMRLHRGRLAVMSEPQPVPAVRELYPPIYWRPN